MNGQPRKMKKEKHRKPVTSKTFTPLIPCLFLFLYFKLLFFKKLIFFYVFKVFFCTYIKNKKYYFNLFLNKKTFKKIINQTPDCFELHN